MAQNEPPAGNASGSSKAAGRGKVLVVDDSKLVVSTVKRRLEGAGFDVIGRTDPMGTYREVLAEHPDIAILDLNMPELQGEALADMLGIPFIFYSSSDPVVVAELARQHRAIGFVSKLDDEKTFLSKFEALFEQACSARKAAADASAGVNLETLSYFESES